MNQGTVGRIEDWGASQISGGYDALRQLAEADFSGAVSVRGAWLFMLNGRIVGISEGSIESFEDADGTAYEAPHPSLPLLFAMRDRGGETRAKYYTDDTPLAEVDRTLSEGGFTGYVELSENVLSGDYFVVYYGGQSLSAAFVGNEQRLLAGDEAFQQANDEVGIYEVRTVDLDVQEVPEPTSTSATRDETSEPGAVGGVGGVASDEVDPSQPSEGVDAADEPPTDPAAGTGPDPSASAGSTDRTSSDPGHTATDPEPAADEPSGETNTGDVREPERRESRADHGASPEEPVKRSDASGTSSGDLETPPDEDPFSEEEEWREARTIPSLDPDESEPPRPETPPREASDRDQPSPDSETSTESEPTEQPRRTNSERVEELRAAIESYEERIAALEQQLEEATTERNQLREERNQLQQRVRELESRVEADRDEGTQADGHLEPDAALEKTDVFVRYGSKGQATLDSAGAGEAAREDVNENLRLETHTRFDDDSIAVDGQPFEDFLYDTLEHRFVRWVVEDLLYEIGDTGNEGGLRDLFDAIPRIDRIEFDGSITSRDEEGEEQREPFDVILRDRMGSPLIVADLNDGRDPATSDMLSQLVERATTVADGQESLAAAFVVTASFFEPAALESASEATDAGFLNRDARKSFVKLSRKRGYHLCLVEARADEFHVAVPEL